MVDVDERLEEEARQRLALRDRLENFATTVMQQSVIDRSLYISVKEVADMLGPNIRSVAQLSAIIGTIGLKTISTRNEGRNTWLTEEQARQVIARVLGHPTRTRYSTGEDDE